MEQGQRLMEMPEGPFYHERRLSISTVNNRDVVSRELGAK